jgi:hypothetical protein
MRFLALLIAACFAFSSVALAEKNPPVPTNSKPAKKRSKRKNKIPLNNNKDVFSCPAKAIPKATAQADWEIPSWAYDFKIIGVGNYGTPANGNIYPKRQYTCKYDSFTLRKKGAQIGLYTTVKLAGQCTVKGRHLECWKSN